MLTEPSRATADLQSLPTEQEDLPFPAIWLRDNCTCDTCRDPRSGQKLFGILDLPADLSIADVARSSDKITVTFAPDGHRAEFSPGWLSRLSELTDAVPGDGRTEQDKELWRAADLAGRMPSSDWWRYNAEDSERLRVLRAVERLGFAILHGTPTAEGTVLTIAGTFGFVRHTNYGELFDVRVEAAPTNLAFTGLAITPHTDNPYRDPVPTMQLLHCISNAVEGGDSGLVDGFEAARTLRDEDPAAFDTLTTTLVPFAWSDARNQLRAERPLIETDRRGRIREVRFNNRSMQALSLVPSEVTGFYDAYRRFAELVSRPELKLTFRLQAGDCVIFDNVRLLHSRTAFAPTGSGARHLQGCYADLDGLASTIAILEAAS